MIVICDKFNLDMVDPYILCVSGTGWIEIKMYAETPAYVAEFLADNVADEVVHAWGDPRTLAVAQGTLPPDAPTLRVGMVTRVVEHNDTVIMGKYVGPPIEEGSPIIPYGGQFQWLMIHMPYADCL